VDPAVLIEELDHLAGRNVDVSPERLKISEKAHLIMPYHKQIDHAREKFKGDKKSAPPDAVLGRLMKTNPLAEVFASSTYWMLTSLVKRSTRFWMRKISISSTIYRRKPWMVLRLSTNIKPTRSDWRLTSATFQS
jgi:hypothetical protein